MAIVDTVWGRITRCNPLGNPADFDSPETGSADFARAGSAARMPKSARRPRVLIAIAALRWLTAAAVLALLAWAAMREIGTSHLQAKLFSRWAGGLTFGVADGASEAIRFPKGGPYDERLGYAGLPGFIESLTAHGFKIESQARWSPGLVATVDHKLFPIYDEKDRAGLRILDPKGGEIYRAQFPERVFPDFASIPSLVVNTLLFVEDRYVLDRRQTRSAIRRSNGNASRWPPRGRSRSWSSPTRMPAAPARWPPRSRSSATRPAAAPAAAWTSCGR